MKDYDEVMRKMEKQAEIDKKILDVIIYGSVDDAKIIIKENSKMINPKHIMKSVVRHCYDLEKFDLIKEAGYEIKGDSKCLEEFTNSGALKPELVQFFIDNGAEISWKAIQNCASRYDIEALKLLVNAKDDFFPID